MGAYGQEDGAIKHKVKEHWRQEGIYIWVRGVWGKRAYAVGKQTYGAKGHKKARGHIGNKAAYWAFVAYETRG